MTLARGWNRWKDGISTDNFGDLVIDGQTDDTGMLEVAYQEARNFGLVLGIKPGPYFIGKSITLSGKHKFEPGALYIIAPNVTLTLDSQPEAGGYQIFDVSNTGASVVFAPGAEVDPRWFGAKGDGVSNDGPALVAASVAAGTSHVHLGPGVYHIATNVSLGHLHFALGASLQAAAGVTVTASTAPTGPIGLSDQTTILDTSHGGTYNVPAAPSQGGIPSVSDAADRNTRFPAVSAPIGTTVFNQASKQRERLTVGRKWTNDSDPPTGTINPRKYTLASWYDSNGISTVGGQPLQFQYITAADITEMQALGYRGQYYAGIDTRDDVCLGEAILEAFAGNTVNGQYWWAAGSSVGIWLGTGCWKVSRPLWLVGPIGFYLHGEGKQQTMIVSVNPDTPAIITDGMNSARFQQMIFTIQIPYAGAYGGTSAQDGSFDWAFHHPLADLDWIGTNTKVGSPTSVTPDYTHRKIASADMPYVKIAGATMAWNQYRGKKLVVIDDPANPNGIGQVRRIVSNTNDGKIYIAGRWDFAPGPNAKFLIDPMYRGMATWHGNGQTGLEEPLLVDWLNNFTTDPVNKNPDGLTLYRFGDNYHNGKYPYTTRTVVSHTQCALTLNAAWPSGNAPAPCNAQGKASLGDFGHGQDGYDKYEIASYAIGGTYLDNTTGAITSGVDNTLTLDPSEGTPWGTNDKVGGYLEIVECASEATVTITSLAGGQFHSTGANRTPGADIGMRMFARSGSAAANNEWAVVNGNGTDWWTTDRPLDSGVGDTVELIDPAKGQILPIIQNTPNSLTTTDETVAAGNLGVAHFHYFAKPPRAGDKVIIHRRDANTNLQGCVFDHVDFSTSGYGDVALSWTRSGDGSQGSECSFYDCDANGVRVGMYARGQNVIDMFWFAGGASGKINSFDFEKGWMHLTGCSVGGDWGGRLQSTQLGFSVVMNQGYGEGIKMDHVYTERPTLYGGGNGAVTMDRCQIGYPLQGFSWARTWTEGDVWVPTVCKGYQWRCVQVYGNASTAGMADPSTTTPGLGDGVEPGSTATIFKDGSGNGAMFVRLDYMGIAGGAVSIDGGTYNQAIVSSTKHLKVGGSAIFSRPDWLGHGAGVNTANADPGGIDIDSSVRIDPSGVGPVIPWHVFCDLGPAAVLAFANAHWISRALLISIGQSGNPFHTGLAAFAPSEFDPSGAAALLALVDAQGQTLTPQWGPQQNPTILGKPPRIGTNIAGVPFRLAGGQGTGNTPGGTLDLLVSPAGASGSQQNPLVVAGRLDVDTTAGNTRWLLYDVTKGTLVRVSIGVADSGGTGFKVLRVPN